MPRWRNGRRGGLKIRFPQGSGGSSPFLGTPYSPALRARMVTEWSQRDLTTRFCDCGIDAALPSHTVGDMVPLRLRFFAWWVAVGTLLTVCHRRSRSKTSGNMTPFVWKFSVYCTLPKDLSIGTINGENIKLIVMCYRCIIVCTRRATVSGLQQISIGNSRCDEYMVIPDNRG